MRSAHCWGSAGRRWLRRMTGGTPVHGNIQNATAKAWRASSELGYRQNRHQIWCSWVSTGQACIIDRAGAIARYTFLAKFTPVDLISGTIALLLMFTIIFVII